MVSPKYLLIPALLFILLIPTALAEQTVKTIEIPLGFAGNIPAGYDASKEFEFNPPDGMEDVLYVELIIRGDYPNPQTEIRGYITAKELECIPAKVTTPNAVVYNYESVFDCSNLGKKYKGGNVTIMFNFTENSKNVYAKARITYYNKPEISASVFGTEYQVGEDGTIFLQLLDDYRQAINNALCFIDIFYPDKTVFHNDTLMTHLQNSDGLYFFDLIIPNQTGIYMLSAKCEVGHDFWEYNPIDDAHVSINYSTTNYGSSTNLLVGNYLGDYYDSYVRFNLTNARDYYNLGDNEIIAAYMSVYVDAILGEFNVTCHEILEDWNESNITYSNRPNVSAPAETHTFNASELPFYKYYNITTAATKWIENSSDPAYGIYLESDTKVLNEIADMNAKEGNPPTYSPTLIVFFNTTESIVEIRGSGELHVEDHFTELNQSIIDFVNASISGLSNLTAEDVWTYHTRTLTDHNLSEILDYLAYINATTTSLEQKCDAMSIVVQDIRDFQVNELSANLSEIFIQLDYINSTSNRTWTYIQGLYNLSEAQVWSYYNRTLTDYNQSYLISLILGLENLTASEIWQFPVRNLTYYPDTVNYTLIQEYVWNYSNRTVDLLEVINEIQAHNASIWSKLYLIQDELAYINTSIHNLNNLSSEGVWSYYNRTLTFYPTVDPINYTYIQEMVWNASNRTLTEFDFVVNINDTNIVNELHGVNASIWSKLYLIQDDLSEINQTSWEIYWLVLNLTLGNVSVTADVDWYEGELVLHNMSSSVQTLASSIQLQAQAINLVTTTDVCINSNILEHRVNATNCIAQDCYEYNFTTTDYCHYGCRNNMCVPPPWIAIIIAMIVAMLLAGAIWWFTRRE